MLRKKLLKNDYGHGSKLPPNYAEQMKIYLSLASSQLLSLREKPFHEGIGYEAAQTPFELKLGLTEMKA